MKEKIRVRKRKKDTLSKDDVFEIEFINDSGAGRCVFSEKALKEQGINPKTWMIFCKEGKNPMIFDTGGGEVDAAESLRIVSQIFGRQEACNLTDAPICIPQGKIVPENQIPYVWIPGMKPFHVTNKNKLKKHCPEKYQIYAKKVEDHIPIFQSKMLVSRVGEKRTQATCKVTGAGQGAKEGLAPVKLAIANGPESFEPEVPDADESAEALYPEVPLVDEDDVGVDPTIHYRSMSKESLLQETNSSLHRMCHFPHTPLCDICVKANLKQRKFAHSGERSNDGLQSCEKCG